MTPLASAIARQPLLTRYVSHLFQRLNAQRLCLVTGAGISLEAGVPAWSKLLSRLASGMSPPADDVMSYANGKMHPEYLGQIVFHRHQDSCPSHADTETWELDVDHLWAAAIREALYKDVNGEISDVVKAHPYLRSLCKVAGKAPLVINFNFDDILDEAIAYQLAGTRKVASTWRPPLVDKPETTTIYHVNGVLPRATLRKRSEELIFTEDSFSSAMARAPDIAAEYLFLRFVQNTMLIIGHSLGDSSLKGYLRKNRDKSPANHHYMIHHLKDDMELDEGERRDVFRANLELYNLITIFLRSDEIGALLSLLGSGKSEFNAAIAKFGEPHRTKFHFYIVGPVGAGKSSVLEQLRCFGTHEEWTKPPPEEMYLSYKKLTSEEAAKVDDFVFDELAEKNDGFIGAGIGIHFMDRAPLDLYAFTEAEEERRRKTNILKKRVTKDHPFQKGEIVFLTADGEALVRRNRKRGRPPEKSGEEGYLEEQRDTLKAIYERVFEVNTVGRTPEQVAKRVARHALFDEYDPVDFTDIMPRYE